MREDPARLGRRTLLGAAAGLGAARTAAAQAVAGRAVAETRIAEWRDATRDRTIPVRIRLPHATGPAPLVLLSHGLGGSRDGLAYLGAALAEAGFVAIHLQHHGSDSALWQGVSDVRASFAVSVLNPRNALDRLRDVVFALDHAAADPALRGRIDPARAAIAGHSFGAWTVSHMLGERLPLGSWGLNLPDPRLAAGIALSPIPPIGLVPAYAYARVRAPILHVTGTEDRGMEGTTPEMREIGYRNTDAPGVLAVLDGASHAAFAGEAGAGPYWNQPRFQARTARLSVLFLRAVLRQDRAARESLLRGEGLAAGDRIESKGFA